MRSERSTRRLALLSVAAMAAVLFLAGCSSSPSSPAAKPATPTTKPTNVAPPPPNASAVAQYLTAAGSQVLTFESATKSLDGGTVPTKSVCVDLFKHRYPLTNASYDALTKAIKGIPNIAIEVAANQDLEAKLKLVTDCTQGKASQSDAAAVMSTSSTVSRELKELKINP